MTILTLAPVLVLELAICLLFFHKDGAGTVLPLLLAGVAASAGGYRWLLPRWRRSGSARRRLGLCLLAAFASFQVAVALFVAYAVIAMNVQHPDGLPGSLAGALVFLVIALMFGNVFFVWVWLLLGALMFGLLRMAIGGPRQRQSTPTVK